MTKFELRKYEEYLLSHGYSVYDSESVSTSTYVRYITSTYVRYIRKTGAEQDYFITFWNDHIFLQYGSSPMVGASDSIACTNKALHYRFKAIPPGLLIVSACQEGRKMLEGLNNYCVEKTLEVLG